jgi:hypothetical protein
MATGSFWGTQSGRGVALTNHPHLAQKLKKKNVELYPYLSCVCKAGYRVNFSKVLFNARSNVLTVVFLED